MSEAGMLGKEATLESCQVAGCQSLLNDEGGYLSRPIFTLGVPPPSFV